MRKHGPPREDAGGYFCSICGLPPDDECPGPPPPRIDTLDCLQLVEILEGRNISDNLKEQLTEKLKKQGDYRGCAWRV